MNAIQLNLQLFFFVFILLILFNLFTFIETCLVIIDLVVVLKNIIYWTENISHGKWEKDFIIN